MSFELDKVNFSNLNLDDLVALLKTLPPDKIARLPIEKMPANIPSYISEKVPIASRPAVEDLLLAVNSHHLQRRLDDQKVYGDDVISALDMANMFGYPASIKEFKNKIVGLVKLLKENKSRKFDPGLFITNVARINSLLVEVRSEHAAISKHISVLGNTKPENENDRSRFTVAVTNLRKQSEYIYKLLGDYYVIRIQILVRAIVNMRQKIESQEESEQILKQHISMLRKDLDEKQSIWKRAFKLNKISEDHQAIQQRIGELVHEYKSNEVVISENDLTLWLDAIIEASLNLHSKDKVTKQLREARISLYYLLNKFCSRQEESALQIAQNPYLQVDAKKAINFVLMSEQFILDYFAKRKNDSTAWLSGAAQSKIDDLDSLQKEILGELRRSKKTLGRR